MSTNKVESPKPAASVTAPTPGQPAVAPTSKEPMVPGDNTSFVDDVTYPDNTEVTTGQTFVKTWRLKNSGTVSWKGRFLKNIDAVPPGATQGFLIPAESMVKIPDTEPGATVDISVTLTAPNLPATTISTWKMVDEKGDLYYPGKAGVYCQVRVVAVAKERGK